MKSRGSTLQVKAISLAGSFALLSSCDIEFSFSTQQIVQRGDFACNASLVPPSEGFQALSDREYAHALEDLLVEQLVSQGGEPSSSRTRVLSELRALAPMHGLLGGALPDATAAKVNPLTYNRGRQFLRTGAAVSAMIAGLGRPTDDLLDLEDWMGSCASDLPRTARQAVGDVWQLEATADRSCLEYFVAQFGSTVLRRYIPDPEKDEYLSIYASGIAQTGTVSAGLASSGNPRSALTMMILPMLSAPEFLMVSAVGESPRTGPMPLSGSQLATKLALHFWESVPDRTLLEMARTGEILEEDGYQRALDHIFSDEGRPGRLRRMVRNFGSRWFRTDRIPDFNGSIEQTWIDYTQNVAGVSSETLEQLGPDAKQELENLFEHVTFDQSGGRVSDLFLTNRSFAEGAALASVYGVPVWNREAGEEPPTFPYPRGGVLGRTAFVGAQSSYKKPIMRGVHLMTEVICEDIPPPPADFDPPADMNLPSHPTAREITVETTKQNQCASCHAKINPPGFALGRLDSLGRFIDREAAYTSVGTGDVNRQFRALNTATSFRVGSNEGSVNDSVSLSEFLLSTNTPHACMTKTLFEYTTKRTADIERDGCDLKHVRDQFVNGNLQEGFRSIANSPNFKTRNIPE